jgi:DoxX-like family
VSQARIRNSLAILQWTMGLVILVEAIRFVMPSSGPDFSRTHMPNAVRMGLGWGEIAGSILLLVPRTAVRGAWLLLAVFGLAIVIHLVHGMYNVGSLVIYAAAAWAIAASTTNS